MEGTNNNEIFQREIVSAKNTEQINAQVKVSEAAKKTQLN